MTNRCANRAAISLRRAKQAGLIDDFVIVSFVEGMEPVWIEVEREGERHYLNQPKDCVAFFTDVLGMVREPAKGGGQ